MDIGKPSKSDRPNGVVAGPARVSASSMRTALRATFRDPSRLLALLSDLWVVIRPRWLDAVLVLGLLAVAALAAYLFVLAK